MYELNFFKGISWDTAGTNNKNIAIVGCNMHFKEKLKHAFNPNNVNSK